MLLACFGLLSTAVLLGAGLAGLSASGRPVRGWRLRATHGGAGAAGLLALALALRGGALRGAFAWDSAALVAAGLATGLAVAVLVWRRRGPPPTLLVLHILAAGFGYLLVVGFALG